MVADCISEDKTLEELTLDEFQQLQRACLRTMSTTPST